MANHRYTSLTDLLDPPQKRTPFVSHGSEYSSDDHSFPIEMFGELCFRERPSLTSSSSSSSSSIWDLFHPPLPPPRRLPKLPPLHGVLNEGADPDQVPDVGKENKTGKGKEKLSKNNCCEYENSGKLYPPPISILKMNKPGKPFVYHEFDAEKAGFVQKIIFLPHENMAASTSASGDFAAAEEEEKEKSSDEAEQKVSANEVKPGNKPQV